MTRKDFLVFLHIQKTAGITVQRLLRRKMGKSLPHRLIRMMLRNTPAGPESFQKSDGYFAGHVCYGVHELLPGPHSYITFLREPISRLLSLYQYSRDNESAYYHPLAVDKSAEKFLLETELHELDNGQVRFIAGGDPKHFINRTQFGKCNQDLLDRAILNIEESFLHVGLTERFDESLLMLARKLNWSSCHYLARNRVRKEKVLVSDALKDELKRRNRLDMALYQFASERHDQDWANSGLADTLAEFQTSNRRHQKLVGPAYDFYAALKNTLRGRGQNPG